jgi:hypothetical protein
MSDAPKNPPPMPRGLVGDVRRARAGATASAAELREFVSQLRGRSPQEMLGAVAESNLVRATVLATVITVVFLALGTILPFAWNRMYPEKAAPPAAAAPAAPSTAPAASAPAAGPAGSAPPTYVLPAAGPAAGSAPADPLAPQGINDVKTADPNKNPLLNRGDDLLKELK